MAPKDIMALLGKSCDVYSQNIASKHAIAFKKKENIFSESTIGKGYGSVTTIEHKTRSSHDIQGKTLNTGVLSDMAIDGAGMFVVSGSIDGDTKFARRGDFRQDELGFWKNGAGQFLKAWKMDDNGNLPKDATLLNSLENVNFANVKGVPVATTVASIAMNLNVEQEALRGSGVEVLTNRTGLNSSTGLSDILLPEVTNNNSLKLGDSFSFTSAKAGVQKDIVFGGIVIAKTAAVGSEIFGAATDHTSFNFAVPNVVAAPNELVHGQQLRITIDGGATYSFSAVPGAESTKDKSFNTISGLARAIDAIPALKARVDKHGRLYIAPTDSDKGLAFSESGGASPLMEKLGLKNLAASLPAENRFNNLKTLKDIVNKKAEVYSLKATFEDRDIKVTSLLSENDFTITGKSPGIHVITSAKLNPTANEKGRASVFIDAPANNLRAGDFIRIKGALGHAQAPAGVYVVGSVDPHGNGFTISLTENGGAFPAAGVVNLNVAAASWEKIVGEKFDEKNGQITATAQGANATITSAAHGLAVNDVIYVAGGTLYADGKDVTLPDGYYIVKVAANANTFEVTPTDIPAANPASANFAGDQIQFRKIGVTGGAFGDTTATFNTKIFEAIGEAANRSVRAYIPNHNYSKGDIISFDNLPENGQDIDGITVENGKKYLISNVDVNKNHLEFKVLDENDAQVNGAGTNAPAASNAATLNDLDPINFSVNDFSRLFEYFGINQVKATYEKTYDSNDVTKNLSTEGNFHRDSVFSFSIKVKDSIGSSHTIMAHLARLGNNKWAVELTFPADKDGVFNIETDNDGLLASGVLEFNLDGSLKEPVAGFDKPIQIHYTNGSALGEIAIDWANELSAVTTGQVTQSKSAHNLEMVQVNGKGASSLTSLEVSDTGKISAVFDNGESRVLYQIPIAMFADINGLTSGANGTYDVTVESGEAKIKNPTVAGAGTIISRALEDSNFDTTAELLAMKDNCNEIQVNARVNGMQSNTQKTILNETSGG